MRRRRRRRKRMIVTLQLIWLSRMSRLQIKIKPTLIKSCLLHLRWIKSIISVSAQMNYTLKAHSILLTDYASDTMFSELSCSTRRNCSLIFRLVKCQLNSKSTSSKNGTNSLLLHKSRSWSKELRRNFSKVNSISPTHTLALSMFKTQSRSKTSWTNSLNRSKTKTLNLSKFHTVQLSLSSLNFFMTTKASTLIPKTNLNSNCSVAIWLIEYSIRMKYLITLNTLSSGSQPITRVTRLLTSASSDNGCCVRPRRICRRISAISIKYSSINDHYTLL